MDTSNRVQLVAYVSHPDTEVHVMIVVAASFTSIMVLPHRAADTELFQRVYRTLSNTWWARYHECFPDSSRKWRV